MLPMSRFQASNFALTFLAYAIISANRKSFSNVKSIISAEWTPSFSNQTVLSKKPDDLWNNHRMFESSQDPALKAYLGALDTTFMVVYAISGYLGGSLVDRFNIRYFLCLSMLGCGISNFLFGCVSEWAHIYSPVWYIAFWALSALFQGSIWPANLAVMANWFGHSTKRGLILGFWSANSPVGNIVGSLLSAQFLTYGYDMSMMVLVVILFAIIIIVFFGLIASPSEIGWESLESEKPSKAENAPPRKVTFKEILCFPGVIIYAMAFASLKLVNYSFFFWLPFYLNNQYHWSQADADSLSIWYDIGGIIGGIFGGLLSDRLRRPPVLFVMIILSIPCLLIYSNLPDDKVLNAFVLASCGCFISGVASLLSSAVTADLGRNPKLVGENSSALGTVSGIVEGTGSMAAALGQVAIPIIQEAIGWNGVFYMFIGCAGVTSIAIGRMMISDIAECYKKYKTKETKASDDSKPILDYSDVMSTSIVSFKS